MSIPDENGQAAVIDKSEGFWLSSSDFIWSNQSTNQQSNEFDIDALAAIGFPRDWPNVYSKSVSLKSLIGKRGQIPARRAFCLRLKLYVFE
eukprot:symbB.v1.2.025268.t1/scaffold2444.1/size78941/9